MIMKKTFLTGMTGLLFLAASCGVPKAVEEQKSPEQIVLENIHSRRSVRTYTSAPVEDEKIDKMVRAGMAAPSGMDRRPWHIVVVTDRAILDTLAGQLPHAQMLREAPLALVVCGDPERSSYWYIDCSAVSQNILLAAEALGLGAVWTGVYPDDARIASVRAALGMPETAVPLNVIPIGYPNGDEQPKDKYDPAKVHHNGW